MGESRISVIVPVYNALNVLHRSVESLLNQTEKNFEIILVDDGSTDGSDILCDEYAEKNANIHVMHRENGGSSSARNTGISAAKNDYIMFIDADDCLDCDTIESISEVIDRCEPDCICFGFRYVIGQDPQLDAIPNLKHNELLDKTYIKAVILPPLLNLQMDDKFIFDFGVNKVYKRCILCENLIRFDESRRIWEDRPFVVQYLKFCESFYSIDRAFYNYVQTVGSLSSRYYLNFFDIILENYHHYTEWFDGEYDFDNQYSNDYWCHSIENMILRSLRQTENNELILANIRCSLDNPQVKKWYAKRNPQDGFESKASRFVEESKYDDALKLYRRKLRLQDKEQKKREYIYRTKQVVKKIIGMK